MAEPNSDPAKRRVPKEVDPLFRAGFNSGDHWHQTVKPKVEGYAKRVCRREQDRDDFAQDAYARLWITLPKFDPTRYGLDPADPDPAAMQARRDKYMGYADGILWNFASEWIRDHRRDEGRRPEQLGDNVLVPDGRAKPGDQAAEFEALRHVWNAIETLTDREQQAFRLRFLNEMPWKKVAELMGEPVESVRSLYSRALEKIRRRLKDQGLLTE